MDILNRYTGKVQYVTAGDTLIEANLNGANLYEANLNGANLNGADLEGANLRGANLERANLRGANLERANLYRADLRGADLEGANLRGANLERANLRGANLERANLKEANLKEANLNWNSHQLLSQILLNSAKTESQKEWALYIRNNTGLCWQDFIGSGNPEVQWGIDILAQFVYDGLSIPDPIKIAITKIKL